MTKKELQTKLNSAISQEEWEQLQRGALPVSDFHYSTLQEMRQADTGGEQDFVDEGLAEELCHVLADYLSKHLADKQSAWKYIMISSIYLTYIAERPMHPIDELEIRVIEGKEGRSYECPNKSAKRETSCHFCVCRKMSNYEIAKRKTQKQFHQDRKSVV